MEGQFEKKQRKGKCMHFFIKSIFDYNSKKTPVNTPNDGQLVEAFTFICEDTVVWAAVLTKQAYIIVCASLIF